MPIAGGRAFVVKNRGYTDVFVAGDGELVIRESAQQALDYLVNATALLPNLILLDINMPGMNGFEFAREAAPLLQRVPTATVVMLTSSSLPNDRERARAMPEIAGYVTKPLTVASARVLLDGDFQR